MDKVLCLLFVHINPKKKVRPRYIVFATDYDAEAHRKSKSYLVSTSAFVKKADVPWFVPLDTPLWLDY